MDGLLVAEPTALPPPKSGFWLLLPRWNCELGLSWLETVGAERWSRWISLLSHDWGSSTFGRSRLSCPPRLCVLDLVFVRVVIMCLGLGENMLRLLSITCLYVCVSVCVCVHRHLEAQRILPEEKRPIRYKCRRFQCNAKIPYTRNIYPTKRWFGLQSYLVFVCTSIDSFGTWNVTVLLADKASEPKLM